MRTLTEEECARDFLIYKQLTPKKRYKTYIAMTQDSQGNPFPVVLKELPPKGLSVYEKLTGMWNPYVGNTYEVIRVTSSDEKRKERCIAVTEYVCAQGCTETETLTLAQFVRRNGPLKEKTALYIAIQICEGLRELHQNGLVHRDIKPDNIMISRYDLCLPQVKIVDFGGGKRVTPHRLSDTTVVGTLGYQAPESISSGVTCRSDIYSIGCLLNFMLTGQEPGLARYRGNHYIVSIIERAIATDPCHRFASVSAMKQQLRHEMGVRRIDRIPLLRTIPGFRTHTLWKELVAGFSYATMCLLLFHAYQIFGPLGILDISLFYMLVPLSVGCNWGNVLRFFPESLRNDRSLFFLVRTLIILTSFFAPMFVDPILGGSL